MIGKIAITISLFWAATAIAGELFVYQTERGPIVLTRALERDITAAPALDMVELTIRRAAHRYQLDPNLIKAIIDVESAFNPQAVSAKGAMGLMQLMPATARAFSVSDPFDIEQNINAGSRFFAELMRKYGDIRLALAAYNAGEPAVDARADVPNFPETRDYIDKVLARYQP